MNEFRVVTVRLDDLKAYLDEYHNPSSSDRCKADGQPWPCNVYLRLRKAVDDHA